VRAFSGYVTYIQRVAEWTAQWGRRRGRKAEESADVSKGGKGRIERRGGRLNRFLWKSELGYFSEVAKRCLSRK